MKTKRSMWMVLMCAAGAGLLVTNCTVKTDDDEGCTPGKTKSGCNCADNSEGHQLCSADGIYGSCICPDPNVGGGANGGGTSTAGTAGTEVAAGAGGMSEAGAPGEGGAAGEAPEVFPTCEDCLAARCKTQYDACDADPDCISAEIDGTGQYERIAKCINEQRAKGLVKRDVVRGCGVTIGASPSPNYDDWAPEGMADTTTNLLNCMADEPGSAAASWANDDANYPVDANDDINPTPWFAGTCAKDACTSAK